MLKYWCLNIVLKIIVLKNFTIKKSKKYCVKKLVLKNPKICVKKISAKNTEKTVLKIFVLKIIAPYLDLVYTSGIFEFFELFTKLSNNTSISFLNFKTPSLFLKKYNF